MQWSFYVEMQKPGARSSKRFGGKCLSISCGVPETAGRGHPSWMLNSMANIQAGSHHVQMLSLKVLSLFLLRSLDLRTGVLFFLGFCCPMLP